MAQEIYYIEQYRHISDNPKNARFAESFSQESLDKALAYSKAYNMVTVAVFKVKLKKEC